MLKKLAIFVSLLSLVLVVGASQAQAYRGDPSVQGPYYSAEKHTAMEKAFENKDYETWKKLMDGRGRASQLITKENFAQFAEAHNLAKQGKTEEAKVIRQKLGLGVGNGGPLNKAGSRYNCNNR